MQRTQDIKKINTKNLIKSTIASFALEGITPSLETLKYCRLRDQGKVTCEQEVEQITRKYREMAQRG